MEPTRYRAKPVEIEAVQWRGQFADLPAHWRSNNHLHMTGSRLVIETPHGPASPEIGDYVAYGVGGEWYPIPRAIFEFKYSAVTDQVQGD